MNRRAARASEPTPTLHRLTASQALTLLNREYSVHRGVVNIPTSIIVDAPLDVGLVEVALRLAVQRWDMFGLRFTRVGREWRQYFGDRDAPVERLDFRGKSATHMERFFRAEGAKPMRLADAPMAKLYAVVTPDGRPGVYSVFNHLIADSWSISMFYKDVFDVCFALADGEPLPTPPRPYEPVLAREVAYEGSPREASDREYWLDEIAGPKPIYTSILGSRVLETYRRRVRKPDANASNTFFVRTAGTHTIRLVGSSDVAACQAFVEERRVGSMGAVFMLALRIVLAAVNGRTPDVGIGSTLARRGTLEEKRSGGSRVQNLYTRTIAGDDVTFADALQALVDKQNAHYRHMDFSSTEFMDLQHKAYGSQRGQVYWGLLFTFQTLAPTFARDVTYSTMWYANGATSIDCYLTIMDDDRSGALRCYWEHRTARVKTSDIDKTHDAMLRVLRAGLANPEVTLGELMDLV